ncbi:hypothetical protein ACQXVK_09635 [Curtobacterium sp. AB451]|uniref:hypothetical protein n=1 Tax=Curtobacterium sp. AB451 TaxID=3422306 RepID=UPI003D33C447
MHLREIDLGGWVRAVAAALLCGFAAAVFASRFAIPVSSAVAVGIGAGLLVTALVVVAWAATGGYGTQRALRAWVRGGPEPVGVPARRRVRWLAQAIDRAGWFAWLAAVLTVLFLALAVPQLFDAAGWQDVVLALFPGVLWAGIAVQVFAVERRHLPRARALYEEELRTASWQDVRVP